MKTQAFKGDIQNISYYYLPYYNKDKKLVKENYYARLKLIEVKQGYTSKRPTEHKGILYLTKEQYNNKPFEVGDRVLVSDKVHWVNRLLKYESRDDKTIKEKLADEYEKRNVKFDTKGKPYWQTYEYAYTFKASTNEISVFEKNNETAYWQIEKTKFFMAEADALSIINNNEIYAKYLFPEEYKHFDNTIEQLKEINDTVVSAKCYIHKNLRTTKNVKFNLGYDEVNKLYFINLQMENK